MIKKEPEERRLRFHPPAANWRTSLMDGFIQTREWVLNRLSGVHRLSTVNGDIPPQPVGAGTDLAGEIRGTLARLVAGVMDEEGTAVDYAALRGDPAYIRYRREYLGALRLFNPATLISTAAARAFWINLYNTLVMDAIIDFEIQKSVIEGRWGLLAFFRRAAYEVGGRRISLEDMEHGILRANRGNPYLPGSHFTCADLRLAWALPLDPRIHFALNCGGRSCPPIRAYTAQELEQQLNLASRNYLAQNVTMQAEGRRIRLPQIFRWFRADFGGRHGILRFLQTHLPDGELRYRLQMKATDLTMGFEAYDWRLNAL